jgi:hypothetical protein
MLSRLFPSLAKVLSVGNTAGGTNLVLDDAQGYSEHQSTATPSGTTQTVDFNEGNSQTIDLGSATGNVTLTLSNPQAGASYVLIFIQGATARNIVWPANVKWPNAGAPTISTGNDDIDVISLFYDGTNFYGSFNQDHG